MMAPVFAAMLGRAFETRQSKIVQSYFQAAMNIGKVRIISQSLLEKRLWSDGDKIKKLVHFRGGIKLIMEGMFQNRAAI